MDKHFLLPQDAGTAFNPANAEKIADGNDSVVFRIGDSVFKKYKQLSIRDVCNYSILINRAVPAIAKLNYAPCVSLFGQPYQLVFEGYSVDEVTVSEDGSAVAVQRFVPSPDLDKLLHPERLFDNYPLGDVQDSQIFIPSSEPTRAR